MRDAELIRSTLSSLTDVIVHDIFSPPVASRIYAYCAIAAYECARFQQPEFPSFAGQLNGLGSVPQPDTSRPVSFEIASLHAFNAVARKLVFTEQLIIEHIEAQQQALLAQGFSEAVIERSNKFGQEMAEAILAWAGNDNYNQTRSFPKYTVSEKAGTWKPTPPAFIDGIEPSWRAIRTFVIDSATQFQPPFPTEYDMDKNSLFYKELMEVYEAVNRKDPEEQAIAMFWDCNPYAVSITGHVMTALKKISPGGHWMEIAAIASEKEHSSFAETSRAFALVSICLADAFISCWDEKYRSNLIRPETVINEYVDTEWQPLLQTPPFPEYTSGHSVISSAAATCLTALYGEDFAFEDDSEVKYGLQPRNFESFLNASSEAAVSRLYGGIHYRPAIDNGVEQGLALGEYIMGTLDFGQPAPQASLKISRFESSD